MKKPEVKNIKCVDLLRACNYLEANGVIGAKSSIVSDRYNNGTLTYLPCFDGRGDDCEDPEDYSESYVENCNALWALYPKETTDLQWSVDW